MPQKGGIPEAMQPDTSWKGNRGLGRTEFGSVTAPGLTLACTPHLLQAQVISHSLHPVAQWETGWAGLQDSYQPRTVWGKEPHPQFWFVCAVQGLDLLGNWVLPTSTNYPNPKGSIFNTLLLPVSAIFSFIIINMGRKNKITGEGIFGLFGIYIPTSRWVNERMYPSVYD